MRLEHLRAPHHGSWGKKKKPFSLFIFESGKSGVALFPLVSLFDGKMAHSSSKVPLEQVETFDVRTVSTRAIAKLFLEIVQFFFFSDVLPDLPQNPVLLQIPADVVNHDFTCPAFTGKSTKNRTGLND
jgi:hypothetical protein